MSKVDVEFYNPNDTLAMDILRTRLRAQAHTQRLRVIEKQLSNCGRFWRNKVSVYEYSSAGTARV